MLIEFKLKSMQKFRPVSSPSDSLSWRHTIAPFFIIFSLSLNSQNQHCTVVAYNDGKQMLVGNNEDYTYPFTSIFTFPPENGKYGVIMFGFSFSETNHGYCGGMNDQGLFIDGLGIPFTGWTPDESKPHTRDIKGFNGNLESYILWNYKSVSQVADFFNTYNVPHLQTGKMLIADKTGASIVVEWGRNKDRIIKREKPYQIATNFIQSNYEEGNYPDYRYNLAEKIFNNPETSSLETVKKVLNALHYEGTSGSYTLYSNICDLKDGDIYIYNFHNFEDAIRINIHKELGKGRYTVPVASLFPYVTFSEYMWHKERVVSLMYEVLEKEGEKGLVSLIELWEKSPEFGMYKVSEDQIVSLANLLKNNGKGDQEIGVCKYAISRYPGSGYALNRLNLAYYNNGDMALALKGFSNLLQADPDNKEARWYEEYIRGLTRQYTSKKENLQAYAGVYGERKLIFEEGKLYYQNGNQPGREMIPVSDELFIFEGLDFFRIRIIIENDKVIAIDGVYSDGDVMRYFRSENDS